MAIRPNQTVSTTTPPASATLTKIIQVKRTDTTAFEAFYLSKGDVVAGAYVVGSVNSDAATSAVLYLGTNPGTTSEIIDGIDMKTNGDGYFAVGAAGGSAMGTQLTADTLYKAIYVPTGTETTGGPWLIKVEYYKPQSGQAF